MEKIRNIFRVNVREGIEINTGKEYQKALCEFYFLLWERFRGEGEDV